MGMISTLGTNLCLWMRYGTLCGGKGMICDYGIFLILPMDKALGSVKQKGWTRSFIEVLP
jgi:hypothetical protein